MSPGVLLDALMQAGLKAADPQPQVARFLPEPPEGRTVVVGAGKGAASMALAVEKAWPRDLPLSGLVVTPYGYGLPLNSIDCIEAAHPVPDRAGEAAAARIQDCVKGLGANDLVLALQQCIEGMEKLLLRPFLAGKELDVVYEQGFQRSVETFEFVDGIVLEGTDHVRDEPLGMKIGNIGAGSLREDCLADRLHEVRLTQPYTSINEQGVICCARIHRGLHRRRPGQLVRLALDKGFKRKSRVEIIGIASSAANRGQVRAQYLAPYQFRRGLASYLEFH